jgi:hypothetical protein
MEITLSLLRAVGLGRIISCSLLAYISIAAVPAQAPHIDPIRLSGSVSGWSGTHTLYVALWDEGGFLKTPVQQVRLDPGAVPEFQFQIPRGRWALSAYEDTNGNGILDMGAFGPKEPYGFWRSFHAWRKPRFVDVASQIDRDTASVAISLNK